MAEMVVSLRIDAKTGKAVGQLEQFGQKTEKSLKRAERQAKAFGNTLRNIAGAAILGTIAREAVRTADAWKNMNAQLRLVTNGERDLAAAKAEVYNIAQRTYTSLDATTQLYTRTARALESMGENAAIAGPLTETISQAMAVSGASAQEAEAAIIQFSQGLASGVLRGEEFNSVMEQAPRLAKVLADELGVTTGELRTMAQDGKLSSDVLVRALKNQAATVQEEYSKLPLTVGRAWQRLKNTVAKTTGELDGATGITAGLAQVMSWLADVLDNTEVLLADMQTLWGNILTLFGDGENSVNRLGLAFESLGGHAGELFDSLYLRFLAFPQQVKALGAQITGVFRIVGKSVGAAFAKLANNAQIAWLNIKRGMVALAGNIRIVFAAAIDAVLQKLASITRAMADAADAVGMDKLAAKLNKAAANMQGMANKTDAAKKKLQEQTAAIDSQIAGLERMNASIDDMLDADFSVIDDVTAGYKAEADAAVDAAIANRQAAEARRKANDELKRTATDVKNTTKATDGLNDSTEDYSKILQKARQYLGDSWGNMDDFIFDMQEAMDSLNMSTEDGIRLYNMLAAAIAKAAGQRDKLKQEAQQQGQQAASDYGYMGNLANGGLRRIINGKPEDGDLQDLSASINGLSDAVASFNQRRASGQDTLGSYFETVNDMAASGAFGPQAAAVAGILSGINSLFRGGLFGTGWYSLNSGYSFNVGAGGATGETWQERKRRLSFFRGSETAIDRSALPDDVQQTIDNLLQQILTMMEDAARQLGTTVADVVEGAFTEERDRNGDIVAQYGTINGVRYNEDSETFATRLLAENLIAQVGAALPQVAQEISYMVQDAFDADLFLPQTVTTYTNEANQIAERWRDNADLLMQGAKLLLAATVDMNNGRALIDGTLTDIVDFVEGMARGGETLDQAYTRLAVSAATLTDALNLMGVGLDMGREAFVTFAAEITDAAGGLDRATSLWQSYFKNFYSESERAAAVADAAQQNAARELADIGLDPSIGLDAFRQMFEAALPTLTAEQVVQWLEAAEALAQLDSAIEEMNSAAVEAVEAQMEALGKYNDFMRGIKADLVEIGNSEFQNALLGIMLQERENIATANELARAAGMQGAAEEDLSAIHQLAARRAAQAIAQLKQSALSLVQQLGYDDLSQVEARIAELEASQTGSIDRVGQAASDMYENQLRAIEKINDYVDGLLLNDQLSPLTPQQKLDEARAQYMTTLLAAQAGDVDALNKLPQVADQYLQQARFMFASNDQYQAIFEQVTGALRGIKPTAKQDEGKVIGTAAGRVISGELRRLYDERDALQAEREAIQRRAWADELAQQIADLSYATGDTIAEVMQSLGVNIESMARDLGIDPNDLSAYISSLTPDMDQQIDYLDSISTAAQGQLDWLEQLHNDLVTLDANLQAHKDSTDPLPPPQDDYPRYEAGQSGVKAMEGTKEEVERMRKEQAERDEKRDSELRGLRDTMERMQAILDRQADTMARQLERLELAK